MADASETFDPEAWTFGTNEERRMGHRYYPLAFEAFGLQDP